MPQALTVYEIFESIQGEGFFTGTPAVFIRFAGCNLRCPWCDQPEALRFDAGREMSVEDIVAAVDPAFDHIVLTGGEPTIQPGIVRLVEMLEEEGFLVHVETNGLREDVLAELHKTDCWITLSPKTKLPSKVYSYAEEIKFIVESWKDVEWALEVITDQLHYLPPTLYLQPLSCDAKSTEICVAACLEYPARFKLSVQTHKYIGVQ